MATSSALRPNSSAAPENGDHGLNAISDGIRERKKVDSEAKHDSFSALPDEQTTTDDNEKKEKPAAASSEKILGRTPDGTGKWIN